MAPDFHVGVIPGDGIVARVGASLVVAGRGAVVEPQVVEQLKDIVAAAVGDDLVRRLAQLMLAQDDSPPLAVATVGEDTVAVFLHGDIDLIWPDGRARGTDHVLGVTETISSHAGFTIVLGAITAPEVERWSDLGAGTLPGGGMQVAARAIAPEEAAEWVASADDLPPTVDTPVIDAEPERDADEGDGHEGVMDQDDDDHADDDAPFDAVSLTDDVDLSERTPLPVAQSDDGDDRPPYERTVTVIGVYSPRGSFNHPDAKYCSRSGVKMGASLTKVLTEGPRPPLGVLTLDDGATLTVRWNTVIGRDPSVDELVRLGHAAPFVVSDLAQSVSRRHALLELIDWDVFITDLGSRNSTYVQAGPTEPLRRLAVSERFALHSGAIVHLGKRSFVYNEHHVR